MRFLKTNNIYKIIRISGSQDNILGISFGDENIEVIEWNFNNNNNSQIFTSKQEVLKQVLCGLESINQALGTDYKVCKIYFSPFDIPANNVYTGLIQALIRYYHSGNKFEEV